ncbi:retrovirus-related pol polyprotein from transposon TNT 1-94 [Tanacetum coccineum]
MNHQTSSVPQIAYQSPQVTTLPMTESPLVDSGFVVLVFSPEDDPIACLNKAVAFLTAIASSRGNNTSGQANVVKCYNCQGEGHIARQCTQPKRPRNATWVPDGQAVQTIIPNNAAFQTEDLDTYDSNCDDISNAKAVLMANISNYGFDVISERFNIDLSSREKMIDSQMDDMIKEKLALIEQVDSLEQNLSKQIKENECLFQIFNVFKSESKEKEDKYMENEIDLEKKIKELDNILFKNPFHLKKAQRIKPTLYDGIVIFDKHVAMPVIDDEETLILEEESRSKMSEKENDPETIKQNISHKPIDYEKLNRLSDDFGKRFTPQQELSAEQAFWLRMSNPTSKPSNASTVKIDSPKELPKVSLVNESLKKLKFHLARFDNVVKIRTTPDARTEGEWGFEHTKAVFNSNLLAKDGLARGIPRLKFQKDHLCSACALGKSKKSSHQPKDTNQEKLYLLHMNLCGPMRVASINKKRYILVIVDDYLRFTWVRFLRTKDEAPEAIIKCIKNIQVRLNATVRNVRTDNGTEFVNQTLREFYENVGISHQTSVARTPQQIGVVERRNRTLVEVARTM